MRTALVIALVAVAAPVFGSKEGPVTLGVIHTESRGIGESGPIVVNGTQAPTGMTSLQVEAFGRTFQLSSPQLKELEGGRYNLIQLSYERGYKELGGRTVYVKLGVAFTSGEEQSVLVVFPEDGHVRVQKVIRHAA